MNDRLQTDPPGSDFDQSRIPIGCETGYSSRKDDAKWVKGRREADLLVLTCLFELRLIRWFH
jgi:hypothetical protein